MCQVLEASQACSLVFHDGLCLCVMVRKKGKHKPFTRVVRRIRTSLCHGGPPFFYEMEVETKGGHGRSLHNTLLGHLYQRTESPHQSLLFLDTDPCFLPFCGPSAVYYAFHMPRKAGRANHVYVYNHGIFCSLDAPCEPLMWEYIGA